MSRHYNQGDFKRLHELVLNREIVISQNVPLREESANGREVRIGNVGEFLNSWDYFKQEGLGDTLSQILTKLTREIESCGACRKEYENYVFERNKTSKPGAIDAYFDALTSVGRRDFLGVLEWNALNVNMNGRQECKCQKSVLNAK